MSFEVANILTGSLAGLALTSGAVCATQILNLRKRLASIEARPQGADGEDATAYQAVAGRMSSLQSSINVLQSGLADVQNVVSQMEERTAESGRALAVAASARATSTVEAQIPAAPINLNRRGQMLRMYRRGDSIPSIASTLGISQGEVKLTIRMQELYSEMPERENSHDRL